MIDHILHWSQHYSQSRDASELSEEATFAKTLLQGAEHTTNPQSFVREREREKFLCETHPE